VPLGYIREFIPAYAAAMFVISSITSALLFVQFSIVRSRALLAISAGYLFSALITIPWALTFPDLFGESDMAGTTWGVLTRIWRLVFLLSVIGYTLLKDDDARTAWPRALSYFAVFLSAAGVLVAVDLVAWLATTTRDSTPGGLPFSILDRSQIYWNALLLLLALFALALLWSRRRSVLDLWLMVAMCGLVIELCLIILVGRRYVVGWYAARVYFLVSSTLVLAVLLSETALLYARLARSVMAQRREREARLMTMDVLSASIAHEMRQPLARDESGPDPGAAGAHKSDDQCGRSHGGEEVAPDPAYQIGNPGTGRRADFSGGYRKGNRPEDRRSYFQSVVHDQVQRHGAGPIDLPIDYRGP
jgi:signal transduction histidine kinase